MAWPPAGTGGGVLLAHEACGALRVSGWRRSRCSAMQGGPPRECAWCGRERGPGDASAPLPPLCLEFLRRSGEFVETNKASSYTVLGVGRRAAEIRLGRGWRASTPAAASAGAPALSTAGTPSAGVSCDTLPSGSPIQLSRSHGTAGAAPRHASFFRKVRPLEGGEDEASPAAACALSALPRLPLDSPAPRRPHGPPLSGLTPRKLVLLPQHAGPESGNFALPLNLATAVARCSHSGDADSAEASYLLLAPPVPFAALPFARREHPLARLLTGSVLCPECLAPLDDATETRLAEGAGGRPEGSDACKTSPTIFLLQLEKSTPAARGRLEMLIDQYALFSPRCGESAGVPRAVRRVIEFYAEGRLAAAATQRVLRVAVGSGTRDTRATHFGSSSLEKIARFRGPPLDGSAAWAARVLASQVSRAEAEIADLTREASTRFIDFMTDSLPTCLRASAAEPVYLDQYLDALERKQLALEMCRTLQFFSGVAVTPLRLLGRAFFRLARATTGAREGRTRSGSPVTYAPEPTAPARFACQAPEKRFGSTLKKAPWAQPSAVCTLAQSESLECTIPGGGGGADARSNSAENGNECTKRAGGGLQLRTAACPAPVPRGPWPLLWLLREALAPRRTHDAASRQALLSVLSLAMVQYVKATDEKLAQISAACEKLATVAGTVLKGENYGSVVGPVDGAAAAACVRGLYHGRRLARISWACYAASAAMEALDLGTNATYAAGPVLAHGAVLIAEPKRLWNFRRCFLALRPWSLCLYRSGEHLAQEKPFMVLPVDSMSRRVVLDERQLELEIVTLDMLPLLIRPVHLERFTLAMRVRRRRPEPPETVHSEAFDGHAEAHVPLLPTAPERSTPSRGLQTRREVGAQDASAGRPAPLLATECTPQGPSPHAAHSSSLPVTPRPRPLRPFPRLVRFQTPSDAAPPDAVAFTPAAVTGHAVSPRIGNATLLRRGTLISAAVVPTKAAPPALGRAGPGPVASRPATPAPGVSVNRAQKRRHVPGFLSFPLPPVPIERDCGRVGANGARATAAGTPATAAGRSPATTPFSMFQGHLLAHLTGPTPGNAERQQTWSAAEEVAAAAEVGFWATKLSNAFASRMRLGAPDYGAFERSVVDFMEFEWFRADAPRVEIVVLAAKNVPPRVGEIYADLAPDPYVLAVPRLATGIRLEKERTVVAPAQGPSKNPEWEPTQPAVLGGIQSLEWCDDLLLELKDRRALSIDNRIGSVRIPLGPLRRRFDRTGEASGLRGWVEVSTQDDSSADWAGPGCATGARWPATRRRSVTPPGASGFAFSPCKLYVDLVLRRPKINDKLPQVHKND